MFSFTEQQLKNNLRTKMVQIYISIKYSLKLCYVVLPLKHQQHRMLVFVLSVNTVAVNMILRKKNMFVGLCVNVFVYMCVVCVCECVCVCERERERERKRKPKSCNRKGLLSQQLVTLSHQLRQPDPTRRRETREREREREKKKVCICFVEILKSRKNCT